MFSQVEINQPSDILTFLISVRRSLCHCIPHYCLSPQVGLEMRRKLRSRFSALILCSYRVLKCDVTLPEATAK